MHEYSVVESLLYRVQQEVERRGALCVTKISVRIGQASGVEPALFETAFLALQENTVCAGAVLDMRIVAAEFRCPRCGSNPEASDAFGALCSKCDIPAKLCAGAELMLDRVELEMPESYTPGTNTPGANTPEPDHV